jgi:hypothetical protein
MLCFRLLNQTEPAVPLHEAISALSSNRPAETVFFVEPQLFRQIPNSPFAYWVSDRIRRLFKELPALDGSGRTAKVGDHPGDGFRFLRLAWEAPFKMGLDSWVPYQKGGAYSPFYCDIHLVANWDHSNQSYKGFLGRPGRGSQHPSNYEFFFRPGLTWPRRTNGLSFRVLPKGCVFADKGPAIFVEQDSAEKLLGLLGVINSTIFGFLVSVQLARVELAQSFEVGLIQNTPCPNNIQSVSNLAHKAWVVKRKPDTANQTSHAFESPFLARSISSLADGISLWAGLQNENRNLLAQIQREIDESAYLLYGIETKNRIAFSQVPGTDVPSSSQTFDDDDSDEFQPDAANLVSDLILYLAGSVFARWDIRYATGERQPPELPDPFAPLPVCPPGMLQNTAGLPVGPEDVPADYPVKNIPWDGILVDDPEHPLDIERRIREVIEIIWTGQNGAPNAAAIEAEACELLEVRSLREYFRKPAGFFADHLKRYSKSRRKAPIYWPLSTPSGGYTIWLYYHRLNDGTLYKVVEQFVEPKQADVQATFQTLAAKESRSRAEDRELETAQTLLGELAAFRDDLLRLAKIWKPNLNDGVVITAAPLWKHFRLPAWQKELKSTWESLERGEYDWAHLAYSLWPERVTEKCKTDRSLAIAHNLEHLCTIEPPKPKKKRAKAKVETEEGKELL